MQFEIKALSLIKISKLALIVLIMSLFFCTSKVLAAEVRFNPAAVVVNSGDEFIVNVVLDAGGEDINTIEGSLQYPPDQMELVETRIASSIITFWIQEPKSGQVGRIPFGGTIVGGFLGTGGKVFSAVFKTPKQELAQELKEQIKIVDAKGFLNDGLGTLAQVSSRAINVTVHNAPNESAVVVVSPIKDTILPESFTPEVGQDPSLFDNRWFVAFSTEDKQSGIAYYEIQESGSITPDESKWQKATSPQVLQDQTRNSYIHVRAVDAAGNSRVAVVSPGEEKIQLSWLFIVGAIAIILFIVGAGLYLKRRRASNVPLA
jgi:hypothetical protein